MMSWGTVYLAVTQKIPEVQAPHTDLGIAWIPLGHWLYLQSNATWLLWSHNPSEIELAEPWHPLPDTLPAVAPSSWLLHITHQCMPTWGLNSCCVLTNLEVGLFYLRDCGCLWGMYWANITKKLMGYCEDYKNAYSNFYHFFFTNKSQDNKDCGPEVNPPLIPRFGCMQL